MERKWKLDREGLYLLGVSGGCDSMAMLDMAYRQGYRVMVASANYKKRKTADLEERLVRDYCYTRSIPVFFLYPEKNDDDNFQNWARVVRYEFYKKIYDRYNCDGLLTGHQLDDHIETYLMDKSAGRFSNFMGIEEETEVFGMKVYRPLLNMRKKETRAYCIENKVPFHDDESNQTDDYRRNYIRHHQLQEADDQQIDAWLKEIDEINAKKKKISDHIVRSYGDLENVDLYRFRYEDHDTRLMLIRMMLRKNGRIDKASGRKVLQIEKVLMNTEENGYIDLHGDQLVYEYGKFYLFHPQQKYFYRLTSLQMISNEYFAMANEGETIEGVELKPSDFPIVIRPYQEGDQILLRYGHKKVSRFLIDRKISKRERYYWPVIVNREGTVIFVSGLGCDVNHFSIKPTVFMLKYHS